jgi:ATP-dependent RNA helicase DDX51/DBP6
LKAKKERRKQRKISARSSVITEEDEEGDNPEDGPTEKTSTVIDPTESTEGSGFVAGYESKKRKKRKLDHSVAEGSLGDQQLQPAKVDGPKLVDELVLNRALPRFPLPTLPNAPSKSELALQGLDRAQIEAELVDPNSTLSINLDTDSDRSVLSLKIRKRLIDLGVNDLFAGISHPFPAKCSLPLRLNSSDGCYSVPAPDRTQIHQSLRPVSPAAGRVRFGSHWQWEDACVRATDN